MSQPLLAPVPQLSPSGRTWVKWLRRGLITLLTLVILGAAGYPLVVIYKLTHPAHKALAQDPAKFGLHPENISFTSAQDALPLKGWYLPAATASDRTVVLAHGFRGTRAESPRNMLTARALVDAGFNVVMFDFRASGESADAPVTLGLTERWDEIAAVRYARTRGARHVGVLGWSMGGHTSIMAMAEDPAIEAGIFDAPYADLEPYLETNLPYWSHLPSFFNGYTLWAARTVWGLDARKEKAVAAIATLSPRPLLLIHGAEDPAIPATESQQLYEAAKGRKDAHVDLWIVPGAKEHAQSIKVEQEAYLARVVSFFQQNLH